MTSEAGGWGYRAYFALYLAANQAVLINFYDGRGELAAKWAKESGLDECSTVRMRDISLYGNGNLRQPPTFWILYLGLSFGGPQDLLPA